jgi:hypothetical protein
VLRAHVDPATFDNSNNSEHSLSFLWLPISAEVMTLKTKFALCRVLMVVGIVLLAGAALSAQDVKYNFMPGTDFSKFHTYKWVPIEGASHPNQIADAEIKSSVDSQLAAKGLTKTDGDKADLLVGYQVAVDKEKQWNAYGMGGVRFGGMGSATSSTISNGSLVLDIYDPGSKQLVWTGTATKTLDPSSNQEKNQKNLDKATAKLLKNYPPPQKK